jgi:hypothetical protein
MVRAKGVRVKPDGIAVEVEEDVNFPVTKTKIKTFNPHKLAKVLIDKGIIKSEDEIFDVIEV